MTKRFILYLNDHDSPKNCSRGNYPWTSYYSFYITSNLYYDDPNIDVLDCETGSADYNMRNILTTVSHISKMAPTSVVSSLTPEAGMVKRLMRPRRSATSPGAC